MKRQSYTIHFKGGPITVWAFNHKEATILAQAEAIKKGWDYTVVDDNLAERANMDKNLPMKFKFKSKINDAFPMYYAKAVTNGYLVGTNPNNYKWLYSTCSMYYYVIMGYFVIIEEEELK